MSQAKPAEVEKKAAPVVKEEKIAGYLEPPPPVKIEAQPKVEAKPKAKKDDYTQDPGSIYYKQGEDYPDPMSFYKEAVVQGGSSQSDTKIVPKGRADSKDKAKGHYCIAHPFRRAYAICNYCHRPFCFEDIIEYQKEYYCIEDIDRVTAHYTDTLTNEYSASSLLTAFILIGTFLLFLYYSNGQLVYLITFIFENPLGFLNSINLSYSLILSSLAVMVLTVVGAGYILLGSKQGHVIAAVVSILAVMLFVYQYIGSFTIYQGVIAGFEFAAFLAAVNSASSEAIAYNQVYERGPEYGLAYGYGARY
jgi:hypothetical protein